jgi:hypothetical protein
MAQAGMRIMKNILSALLATAFLSCVTVQGMAEEKEDFSRLVYDTPPLGHFDFEQDPRFSMIVLELKYMLASTRKYEKEHGIDKLKQWNNFCAVGYVFSVDPDKKEEFPLEKEVVVYWKEKGRFIRWEGDDPERVKQSFHYARSLMFSFSYPLEGAVPRKDLDKTFLGTRQLIKEDAENMIADCEKHGKQYIIGPFTPPSEEH